MAGFLLLDASTSPYHVGGEFIDILRLLARTLGHVPSIASQGGASSLWKIKIPHYRKLVAYASDRATHKNLDIWVHPLTQGGQPIRLTTNEADDDTPDFSPDGGLIVFHSNREGGGIYTVPAYGGEERLLVGGGRFPRFSPDGKWVAYCMHCGGGAYLEKSEIYIVPVAGGEAKRLAADVPWASLPVFSGDGRYILFEGAAAVNDAPSHDWWVTPAGGGQPVKTGAFRALAEQGLLPYFGPRDWIGDQVFFVGQGQVWGLPLTTPGWRPRALARRVTSGSNSAGTARVNKLSLLAFGTTQFSGHLWKLRLEPRTGKALGGIEELPYSGGTQIYPTTSPDGRLLAYTQVEPTGNSVRIRDLLSGRERTLVNGRVRPKLSPDGSQVAYCVQPGGPLYVMPSSGGESTLMAEAEGKLGMSIYAWASDGRKIVYWTGKPTRFELLDPLTRQTTELIAHPKYDIYSAEMSPDQRWIAFDTTPSAHEKPLWIAARRDGKVADEKDWIRVSAEGDDRPWWSPDGNLLYMVSWRDGNQCIWAQKLDPATKRPAGEAFPIYHLHNTRGRVTSGGLASFGPAILPDGIIIGLEEVSGDVWIGERKE